jgi:hypothetical protein
MSKDLKDKAINIKGKSYVLVSDRVLYFNETYPDGAIETEYQLVDKMFIVKATVQPNDKGFSKYTGHSQAIIGDGMVNKTAALENAETSAVGRALAMMGIGVIESIASVDEINKATGSTGQARVAPENAYTPMNNLVKVDQIKQLLEAAKKASGQSEREQVLLWFKETVGMEPNQVKQIEFDNVLRWIEEEHV